MRTSKDNALDTDEMDLTEYARTVVGQAPPLTDHQRLTISRLLFQRTDSALLTDVAVRMVRDDTGRLLYVGEADTALRRSLDTVRGVAVTTDFVPPGDVDQVTAALRCEALFEVGGSDAVRWLVEREQWSLLTPVMATDRDGAPAWRREAS